MTTRYGTLRWVNKSLTKFGEELDRTNVISEDFKQTLYTLAQNIMLEEQDRLKADELCGHVGALDTVCDREKNHTGDHWQRASGKGKVGWHNDGTLTPDEEWCSMCGMDTEAAVTQNGLVCDNCGTYYSGGQDD